VTAARSRGALQPARASQPARPANTQSNQSIGRVFELQARTQPGKLAIAGDSGDLTYAELNALANGRAKALRGLEVRPEEPVAILLDQGAGFIATMLGVLKTVACFVPLDPANPPGRNLQMLQDTGARILLTSSGHLAMAEGLTAGVCTVLNVDSIAPHPTSIADGDEVSRDSLACILYTSGSTGRPKGVMHDHRTLLHNASRHREAFRITPADKHCYIHAVSMEVSGTSSTHS